MALSYTHLSHLLGSHPGWRLLRAENAPLIIAFIDAVFVQPNVRIIDQPTLVAKLDDFLYQLRDSEGENRFPRGAMEYLADWSHDGKGWLRKFYPIGTDEPHYDLTPATERVLSWLESLTERTFVGAESRLLTIFQLLRQMVLGAEEDSAVRIETLERRKAAIEEEIERIREGDVELMSRTALRERFLQVSSTARELLSDFRAVEANFRKLDNQVRERIATWDGTRGALLEQVFGERDAITDSDQGASFRAFWDFLMSPQSQEELSSLLERVFSLEAVKDFSPDPRLKRIHFDWLEAGEHTQRTVAALSRQLRQYLDNKAYLENRRIIEILDSISRTALAVREEPPRGTFTEIDDLAPRVALPLERPLYQPATTVSLESHIESADGADIDTEALFNARYVDLDRLRGNVSRLLQDRAQVLLRDVIEHHPLTEGLPELIGYLSLAGEDRGTTFDESRRDHIAWQSETGIRRVHMPRIIFSRT
jgi:hypothetical protein